MTLQSKQWLWTTTTQEERVTHTHTMTERLLGCHFKQYETEANTETQRDVKERNNLINNHQERTHTNTQTHAKITTSNQTARNHQNQNQELVRIPILTWDSHSIGRTPKKNVLVCWVMICTSALNALHKNRHTTTPTWRTKWATHFQTNQGQETNRQIQQLEWHTESDTVNGKGERQ